VVGITTALSALVVLRYTDFVAGSIAGIGSIFIKGIHYNPLNLIFPIGLSFYSFKMVSYLVDVYRENAPVEKHAGYFALYVSFFPQIFSGPIDRAVNFLPGLKKRVSFDIDEIVSGFRQVAWGVFKKMVIADRLAIFVNATFQEPGHKGLNLLFGAYFYAFQIYCDFSGYTDIAIGVSRMLGFQSMKNFDFPYFSKSITQFWNRWHISFSTWLRDYLFLPTAYAVMRPIKAARLYGIKTETWGYIAGMLSTMFLGGLWHGPSWTFVVWGLMHGIYLSVGHITKKSRKKLVKKIFPAKFKWVHDMVAIFITFNLVSLAWIVFRSDSIEKAYNYVKYIQFRFSDTGMVHLVFNLILVIIFILMEIVYKNIEKISFYKRIPLAVKIAGFALFICLTIIFAVDTSNEFIYFKF